MPDGLDADCNGECGNGASGARDNGCDDGVGDCNGACGKLKARAAGDGCDDGDPFTRERHRPEGERPGPSREHGRRELVVQLAARAART